MKYNTNILVTGANGQLGKSLKEIQYAFPELSLTFYGKEELDISERISIDRILNTKAFQYCINAAAFTHVDEAEKNPEKAYEVNALGVRNLARACKQEGIILVHISTDYVFDGAKNCAYTPHDAPNPINIYGLSKLQGEVWMQEILDKFFIVRTSWLYSEYGDNFYTKIIEQAKTTDTLYVTDRQRGNPTHAQNLATYLLNLIDSPCTDYGIHHFTDGETMTWFEFAQRILESKGLSSSIRVVKDNNYRSFAARPQNSVLSENGKGKAKGLNL